jgi:hypothetical protein
MGQYIDLPIVYGSNGATNGNVLRARTVQENLDAFARLRVSNPQTIFDSKQLADNQPLFWDDAEVSGTGTGSTYNANQASTTISVGANTAGHRVRQTRRWFNYQPGKSQLVEMTAVMSTNGTKRLGQFNQDNGIYFQHDSNGLAVGIRSKASGSVVDRLVRQTEWNYDKMDGKGPSGINLDVTKTNIFFFDYEWLGVGTVAYGFFVDRTPYYVHFQHHANLLDVVYMSTPNLPLRYEVINDGTAGASSLTHICTTVITEGGRQVIGLERGISRDVTGLTTLANTNIYPVFSVRLKQTHLGAFIRFVDFSAICTTQSAYIVYLVLNPTFVGTAPSYTGLTNSAIEVAQPTNATTITGGTILFAQVGSDSNNNVSGVSRQLESDLVIGSDIAGVADQLVLAIQPLSGAAETFISTINFSETN